MSGATERPLRADAARNRARLLDAATEVFAARGIGVPTEEIARAAGVGVGTLFRHFPTKEALLEAVMVRRLETITARITQLAAETGPAEAFFGGFRLVVEHSAGKQEFTHALAAAGVDVHASLRGSTEPMRAQLSALLAAAQQAGAVRPDIGLPDLIALLVGVGTATDQLAADPAARERVFDVVFTGLRPH
ncbi:TetR/AcrR family transcriptional regulator [Kitasatospora sp. NPDC056446]|uniref:TetR/AcrR family transcriptional regulator n=1 Tax=Kitasatospora sp. NPDC056446 TaxID=3345819 RepID=UPI0036D16BAA